MRIKEIMTPTVISIRSDQSLLEVRELMLSNNLRRIPVTDKEGLLMGIVTDGDVSRATPSDASVLDRYEANYLSGQSGNRTASKPPPTCCTPIKLGPCLL